MKKIGDILLRHKLGWLLALTLFVAVNWLGQLVSLRVDLTKEKRYSLSSATTSLANELTEELEVTIFLKGEFPSGFRKLAANTEQFLRLLKEENPGRIRYRFLSPLEEVATDKTWGDSLLSLGALNINLTVQKKAGQTSNIIFPVALINYQGKQSLISLFPGASRTISQLELNRAEALLEYQFAIAIDKLLRPAKPGIAYEIGHGEPVDESTYQLRRALQDDYELRTINLKTQPSIPKGVSLLLIVKPSLQFSEAEKFKIDQFLMRGGKLLCFIDNLYAEMDSFARKPDMVAYDRNLNLGDLFFRYGARINTDLVMDLRCEVSYIQVGGTLEQPQNEFLPWNYFPLVSSPTADNKLRTSGYIGMRFANSIDTIEVPGVLKTPLLASSERSRVLNTPAIISLNENSTAPENSKFNKAAIPVAMLLEGPLPSLYRNRISPARQDSLQAAGMPFLQESLNGGLILVGDGDMVLNEYIPSVDPQGQYDPQAPMEPIEMGWNKYTRFEYLAGGEAGRYFIPVANKEFLLNSVEYLVSNPAISQVRGKEITLRLLDGEAVKEQRLQWQLINIGLPVIFLLLGGLLYQYWRKLNYAR